MLGKNEMVKDSEVQEFCRRFYLCGEFSIGIAWLQIARRMIVQKDKAAGPVIQGQFEDDSRVGCRKTDTTFADLLYPQKAMGLIQKGHCEDFMPFVHKKTFAIFEQVRRTSNGWFVFGRGAEYSSAQFHGRCNFDGLGLTYTTELGKLLNMHLSQGSEVMPAQLQDLSCQCKRRAVSGPVSEQDGQEFPVFQIFPAMAQQFLAWSLLSRQAFDALIRDALNSFGTRGRSCRHIIHKKKPGSW